jgi:hypothetical protein
MVISTSPYKGHDFNFVPFSEHAVGMPGAGNQVEISFDGQVAWLHLQLFEQTGHGGARRHVAGLVIDANLHGFLESNT